MGDGSGRLPVRRRRERRAEPRLLCADLLELKWTTASGEAKAAVANLEDISNSGACVQIDRPVPEGAAVRITYGNASLEGRVRYCVFRDTGYFAGVQFAPGTRWNKRRFRPKHLLDPRRLLGVSLREVLAEPRPH